MNKKYTITFLTGGARSGKSTHALKLAQKFKNRVFIATATAFDKEMKERILKHKIERGDDFYLIEEELDLALAISKIPKFTNVVIIDCLTVWLSNLMYKYGSNKTNYNEIDDFLNSLKKIKCNIVIVSNEVGLGIVPQSKDGRLFRDLQGKINQRVASIANKFFFMASGYPIKIK